MKTGLRWTGLILISVFTFTLVSFLVPFSGKSVLWWLSRSCSTVEIFAYSGKFYLTSITLFIVPISLVIAFFGVCLFVASEVLPFTPLAGNGIADAVLKALREAFPYKK